MVHNCFLFTPIIIKLDTQTDWLPISQVCICNILIMGSKCLGHRSLITENGRMCITASLYTYNHETSHTDSHESSMLPIDFGVKRRRSQGSVPVDFLRPKFRVAHTKHDVISILMNKYTYINMYIIKKMMSCIFILC